MDYRLSIIVRHKMYLEALRVDHGHGNLRILVAHANLLDKLVVQHAPRKSKHSECGLKRDRSHGFIAESVDAGVASVEHTEYEHLE